ncbi:substrate-binding domain-containing protein [Clostridium beijerinckii]|jgi:monosaccharide ABC transporter substrate-binding protein, CUT2 family (TC 3.A.1.2.-)|uniref:Substrate-binding domain-containing protein n=2 Tax=Clostridium beijerinckii TaxID=1520 RepID=A0AAE2V2D7_CLOBE|nr:substrate-binding domain-containing protein [Clostridium beijerinckii]ABR34537.1 periplasmic binding protein/LacI transcriptional regulator [Clostridium beijerinckii NCIMB 8052]AIU03048.1 periplasmic binding protein/LacI transcriptional regulator [Clostridium beijerinckii ATCC 35702]MBC2459910.1 sugar ABC transporter substrate-binding protein [Clostridium beijerinckii]MBC2477386.1 sugar ABC transporter substrate-binding protein [Clostridium beijerinckii]MBF7810837.1 substrate-binding domain
MKFLKSVLVIILIALFLGSNLYFINLLRDKKVEKEPIKPKIVLISHIKTNPYWLDIKAGAERAAKERGAVVEFLGPTTASTEDGLKLFDMATSAKVSGIITYVQEEGQYKKKINSAMEKGIPVVTIDSDEEDSNRIAYVGTDNVLAGQVAGKEMVKQIGTSGNVAIVMGGKNVKNQKERVEGFTQYIKSNSNLKIVDTDSSDAMLLEAEIITRKILNRNDNINALFCTSALDGIGAARAVKDLNYKDRVKIICFDDLDDTLSNIRNGLVSATIVQKSNEMGYRAVNIIMDKIEGKSNKFSKSLIDVNVINKSDVDSYKRGDDKVEN